MNTKRHRLAAACAAAFVAAAAALPAHADIVTDWNARCDDLITEARIGTPPAIRVMAIVQTAAYRALAELPRGASAEAALAAAHRATLPKLLPTLQASVDHAANAALAAVPEGAAKAAGIAAGEKAAAAVLAQRADDGAASAEAYRPHAAAGAYVPTAAVAVPQWPQRKPWLLANAAQFRPAAPPALTSETWVRDFNETKAVGARTITRRTPEQTEIARFWEYSLPAIYHGVLRSVALQPGRDALRNARLLALAAQAMDDGLIAGVEAKYHYNFWRPVTAIRNGDLDGNDATQRDASWTALIDAPMHPEYPSTHSVLAGAVGTLIQADLGDAAQAVLATSSPSAKGATRRWPNAQAFMQEVAEARIASGIHFRSATEAGTALGQRIGALAAQRLGAEH
jgi:hypothetical protein